MAFIYENLNPCQKTVGDCVVRGLSKVLNQEWEDTFLQLFIIGLQHCDMPSSNAVWSALLQDKGFTCHLIENPYYTVEDFCIEHPQGTYLACTGSHVIPIKQGDYFDIWDSGREAVQFYFKKEIDNV